ncbi:MAG: DUF2764 family protein [Kiritimatiellae bacterium]|nr:DUF2764 family protein [Kiritimatiellia bacterium]
MAADYLVSSLQPLALDGPPPCTAEQFLGLCRSQLPAADVAALEWLVKSESGQDAALGKAPSGHRILARWRDLDAQLRNAAAAERARLRRQDAAKWLRPVEGCSLYWANRAAAAFQEKDPARRERLLDQVRWDAAGELTPPAAPLSLAAVFTYAIRLGIVLRRAARDTAAGNDVFNRLTAATKIEFKE